MWASNGPIYVKEAMLSAGALYLEVSAICFIMVKIARPDFILPEDGKQVFEQLMKQHVEITHVAYEYLFLHKE
jgi:hypothetical protein